MKKIKRSVAIFGAGTGLGGAIAEQISTYTSHIHLVGKSLNTVNEVKKRISRKAVGVDTHECDLTRRENVRKLFLTINRPPPLNVIVNCVGIWHEGMIDTIRPSDILRLFQANVFSAIYLLQETVPIFTHAGGGIYIQIISTAGIEASARWPLYASTKHALLGFMRSMQLQLSGKEMRLISVLPGGMDTDFYFKAGCKQYTKNEPWMMNTKDVAKIVCGLLDSDASAVPSEIRIDRL